MVILTTDRSVRAASLQFGVLNMKNYISTENILVVIVVGCWIYNGAPLTATGLGYVFGTAVSLSIPVLLIALIAKLNSMFINKENK